MIAGARVRNVRQAAVGQRMPVVGRILVLLVAGLLAGCDELSLPKGGAPDPVAATAPHRIGVSGRAVVISGPEGYCIDKAAARDGAAGAFVLLGSCAALAQSADAGQPVVPAVLTASVSPPGAQPIGGQLAELNRFFLSPEGRAASSRSGRAQSVTVLQSWGSGAVFYLVANDTSPSGGQKLQQTFWRAVLDVKGRIVTLNVAGLRAQPLSPAAGRATLEAFVRQVQRENRTSLGG